MARSGAPRGGTDILRAGVIAALAWIAADTLGVPDLLGAPSVPLIPVAALVGAGLGWLGATRWILGVATALLLLMLLVAFTPILRGPAHALIVADPVGAERADAIMVLSAAVSRDSLLSPVGAERLVHGVSLLRAGHAGVIITSRIRHRPGPGGISSDADQARLLSLGPDTVRWVVIDSVATTHDEALRAAELAAREGWRHLIVVTSPMHTRRACATFRKTGLLVTCAPAPSRGVALQSLATAGDRLAAFGPWLYETVGWWWYRMRGWV